MESEKTYWFPVIKPRVAIFIIEAILLCGGAGEHRYKKTTAYIRYELQTLFSTFDAVDLNGEKMNKKQAVQDVMEES